MMENDAHLILENSAKKKSYSVSSSEESAKVRAKYDFVPVETH